MIFLGVNFVVPKIGCRQSEPVLESDIGSDRRCFVTAAIIIIKKNSKKVLKKNTVTEKIMSKILSNKHPKPDD